MIDPKQTRKLLLGILDAVSASPEGMRPAMEDLAAQAADVHLFAIKAANERRFKPAWRPTPKSPEGE